MEFLDFFVELVQAVGLDAAQAAHLPEHELAAIFLARLNKFLYQSHDGLPPSYLSSFHEYWERHHLQVIGLSVDDSQCKKLAESFEPIYAQPEQFPELQIRPPVSREGVSDSAVANVRFFTAIQDFKIDIRKGGKNPFTQYLKTPEWFTAEEIARDPAFIREFLAFIGADTQGDKRQKWMSAAADYLLEECEGDAYHILEKYHGDAGAIRNALASPGYLGYSFKKADMFLRDMAEWGIWTYSSNVEQVNVASDANTMRIALRAGLIRTRIPLLASYLDVYCYQYSAVDEAAAAAWRRSWEIWSTIPDNHRPPTPASMDYLLYQGIGRTTCRRTPKCQNCILNSVCPTETRRLNPPKSISQKGKTGWDSGATNEGGGGGIMS